MSGSVLVDTSVLVDFLRSRVGLPYLDELVVEDRVVLSEVVRMELLAGVRSSERFRLAKMLSALRRRGAFPATETCEQVLQKARGSGLYGGIPDLLILSDAIEEQSSLATTDQKLKRLARVVGVRVVDVG